MSRRRTKRVLDALCPVTSKRRYRDELAAKLVLAHIQAIASSRRDRIEQRAYWCADCKGWHLTSQAKRN